MRTVGAVRQSPQPRGSDASASEALTMKVLMKTLMKLREWNLAA
jgi:hypothetical protein